jgi:hypothetical protein
MQSNIMPSTAYAYRSSTPLGNMPVVRAPGFVGAPKGGYTTTANEQETYEQQPDNNTMWYVVAVIAAGAIIYFATK